MSDEIKEVELNPSNCDGLIDEILDADIIYFFKESGRIEPKSIDIKATLEQNGHNPKVRKIVDLVKRVRKSRMKKVVVLNIDESTGDSDALYMNRKKIIDTVKEAAKLQ